MKNEDFINNKITIDKDNDICEELKKSIETLILYRSLYILKKKFELGKETIRKIYNSFNLDTNENVSKYCSYQVSIDNFIIIAKTVFEKCNMLLIIINTPKDILLSNLFLDVNKKIEEMTSILKEIKEYITNVENPLVKKYNCLYYDKKIKARMIKDVIDLKQNKKEKKMKLKKEKSIIIKENKEIKEEKEIQRKIVEYNRKGKIIKTHSTNSTEEINKIEINFKNNENEVNIKLNENNIKKRKEKEEEILEKNINLIDIENDKNYDNILYIETLPLIIADFIQQFPFYCIIETEDELNEELSILFDKELVEKINKYEESLKNKNEKIINKEYQSFLLRKNKIENNINIYENLINEKKLKGENTSYLESMLEKLLVNNIIVQNKLTELISQNKNILNNEKEEFELNNNNNKNNNIESMFETSNITNISKIENNNNSIMNSKINNLKNKNRLNKVRIKPIIKPKLDTNIKFDNSKIITNKINKEDLKIMASIKEIFNFYSRQHNSIGAKLLFSDLEKNMEQIGSSEFYKFCVEFNIPITRLRSNDIFKKALTLSTSTYHKLRLMNYDEFLISLKLISKEISQNKLDLIRKNIENEKMKLNETEEKQKKQRELEKYNNSINFGNKSNKNKMMFDKSEFYYQCEKKKFTNEIFNLENKYTMEKEKTEEELFKNFLNYLGINSKNEYKKKFKGFLLPFQTHEKKNNLIKVKNGIGSRLESEIIEASKIFALQKEERMKISLSKEMIEKRNKFEEKKRLFKIKNEKLIKDIERNENRKYSDKLIDLKKEINRKKMERLEIQRKEEYERKNIISWNRLENINMNSLEVEKIEKICNDTNNSDEEIINKISDENHKFKKSIQKNNSAFQLMSNNVNFPKITKKTSIENTNKDDNEFDNKNSLFNNY